MKLLNRIKYTLLGFLITINVAIRYPLKGHEYTGLPDTISVHLMANSISQFNCVKFYINPLSYFGFYPYSYPTGVPFLLSAVSQCTGIDMEWTIWIVSTFLGVFGGFAMYLFAGEIKNDDLFKFFAALTFSVSYGFLLFTMWSISTRGAFVALAPLFLFLMLRARRKGYKYAVLTSLFFVILIAIHHMYILLVPFIFAYLITKILYNHKQKINNFKVSRISVTIVLSFSFILFLLPIFIGWYISFGSPDYGNIKMKIIGIVLSYGARMGLAGIFGIVGFIHLFYSKFKSFEHCFLIIGFLFLAFPMGMAPNYVSLFFLCFASLLIALGMIKIIQPSKHKKQAFSLIVAILVISTALSGFFLQVKRPGVWSGQHEVTHIDDKTYNMALWIKKYANGTTITDPCYITITAISGVYVIPSISQADLIYGFIDKERIKTKIGPIDRIFDDPLIDENKLELTSKYKFPRNYRYDDALSQSLIQKYDVRYALKKYEGEHNSIFMRSIAEERYKIYDDGGGSIWCLR